MTNKIYSLLFCLLSSSFLAGSISAYAQDSRVTLPTIEAETFDEEDFIFPKDLKGQPVSMVFLTLSSDRENGEAQREASMAWQKALDDKQLLPEGVLAYHFPVMQKPPFFIKGMIVGNMADAFEHSVPANQSGMLFVKDLDAFASQNHMSIDKGPVILFVSAQGTVLKDLTGNLSDERLDEVKGFLKQYQ